VNQNVEVVWRVFDALRRRDIEAVLQECDPEVEFMSLIGQIDGRSYHGHDGMRAFFSELMETWDVWIPRAERVHVAGDDVLAIGSSQVRGSGSGVEITIGWGTVVRLHEGRVLEARMYPTVEEATAAFQALPAQ
jgi:ketosteroid isomerase-like protein